MRVLPVAYERHTINLVSESWGHPLHPTDAASFCWRRRSVSATGLWDLICGESPTRVQRRLSLLARQYAPGGNSAIGMVIAGHPLCGCGAHQPQAGGVISGGRRNPHPPLPNSEPSRTDGQPTFRESDPSFKDSHPPLPNCTPTFAIPTHHSRTPTHRSRFATHTSRSPNIVPVAQHHPLSHVPTSSR